MRFRSSEKRVSDFIYIQSNSANFMTFELKTNKLNLIQVQDLVFFGHSTTVGYCTCTSNNIMLNLWPQLRALYLGAHALSIATLDIKGNLKRPTPMIIGCLYKWPERSHILVNSLMSTRCLEHDVIESQCSSGNNVSKREIVKNRTQIRRIIISQIVCEYNDIMHYVYE